jgi:hypothetical protein
MDVQQGNDVERPVRVAPQFFWEAAGTIGGDMNKI